MGEWQLIQNLDRPGITGYTIAAYETDYKTLDAAQAGGINPPEVSPALILFEFPPEAGKRARNTYNKRRRPVYRRQAGGYTRIDTALLNTLSEDPAKWEIIDKSW